MDATTPPLLVTSAPPTTSHVAVDPIPLNQPPHRTPRDARDVERHNGASQHPPTTHLTPPPRTGPPPRTSPPRRHGKSRVTSAEEGRETQQVVIRPTEHHNEAISSHGETGRRDRRCMRWYHHPSGHSRLLQCGLMDGHHRTSRTGDGSNTCGSWPRMPDTSTEGWKHGATPPYHPQGVTPDAFSPWAITAS